MRGIYTAGVLDSFMERGLEFDAIIGVSAGALFGVNYLSKQMGRAIRYNKKYNSDINYMGIVPLLKTGNIIDTEYAYERVPQKLDPIDDETFKASEVPFYAVITNMRTGQPEYVEINSVFEQMDVLRASGSMPFVSRPVEINGELYLDGAVTDSIPFQKMLDMGYERLVVVLTKDKGYVKRPMLKALTAMYKKYPNFYDALNNRHNMYNNQMKELFELERKGIAKVIQPVNSPRVGKLESNPDRMNALYMVGREDGKGDITPENKVLERRTFSYLLSPGEEYYDIRVDAEGSVLADFGYTIGIIAQSVEEFDNMTDKEVESRAYNAYMTYHR